MTKTRKRRKAMPRDVTVGDVARLFRRNRRFVLTTHSKPDADGLGSELALHRFLRRIGKISHIVNVSDTPTNLRFLCSNHDVKRYRPRVHKKILQQADVIAAIDIGSVEKVDKMGDAIFASPAKKILIDHHVRRDRAFDWRWVRENASSSGEMVYDLITAMDPHAVTPGIAQPLYAAIAHDTGDFNYDRTSARTFRVAAELVEHGAQPYGVFKATRCSRSLGQLRLIAETLAGVRTTPSGRVAWCTVPQTLLRKHRVKPLNLPRIIDHVLTLQSIEIAVLLVEVARREIKVSLRSKNFVDVSALACTFGGGGHRKSSGFNVAASLPGAVRKVVAAAEKAASRKRRGAR
jgi:phosphoesterase RecJ-like protein